MLFILLRISFGRTQIGDLITFAVCFLLLSLTVKFLGRNDDKDIYSGHLLLLSVVTFTCGIIGLALGEKSHFIFHAILFCGIPALAISANLIGLSYRTSTLIALTAPFIFLFSNWLGNISQDLITKVLLT